MRGFSKMTCKVSRKTISAGRGAIAVVLASAALLAQQKPAPSTSPVGLDFPVIMQQNVVAGKTPAGAKIEAKLAVATLVNGVVVPQGAILSGVVSESVAKSATAPSRLAICMESAHWKHGTASIRVYLTAWYYPVATLNQDLSSGLPDVSNNPRTYTGAGIPGARNSTIQPFPDANAGASTPNQPSSTSQHRALMKDVESARNSDGAITLTSKHSNLKLDKQTIYVFAAYDLLP